LSSVSNPLPGLPAAIQKLKEQAEKTNEKEKAKKQKTLKKMKKKSVMTVYLIDWFFFIK
jgi:hypothetical protein